MRSFGSCSTWTAAAVGLCRKGSYAAVPLVVFALLGACASDSASSPCETVCSKMEECCSGSASCEEYVDDLDQCVSLCQDELDEAARVLQRPQSENFLECLDGFSAWIRAASCGDLDSLESPESEGGPPDCFAEAVKDPECEDPGRAEYAESICLRDECTEAQRANCLELLMPILENEVPCLSAAGLPDAVMCEFDCESSTTPSGSDIQVDQSVSNWTCSYPG